MSFRLRRLVCIGIGAAFVPLASHAQDAMRESAVKAAFLFRFAAFVEWPAGTFQHADQPLVIGVMGDDEVARDLDQIVAGRAVAGHPVVARRVDAAASAAAANILFIGSRREGALRETIGAVAGPVLVVTEQPGALRLGSVLNFMQDDGRVRFSASLTAAQARNLKLSSRLLAVAQDVEGRAP